MGSGSFFQKSSLPYKALAAYTARDSLIFKGRERETAQLVGRISEQPVLKIAVEPWGARGGPEPRLGHRQRYLARRTCMSPLPTARKSTSSAKQRNIWIAMSNASRSARGLAAIGALSRS